MLLKRQLDVLGIELSVAQRERAKAVEENVKILEQETIYSSFLVYGGLTSRLNVFTDAFHKNRPNAAKHLFGFETWEYTKTYMECFWPRYKPPPQKKTNKQIPEAVDYKDEVSTSFS
jgi:hypothetical protein